MTPPPTTFYLTAKSADKPPGRGVHESLDAASFPAESLQALKCSFPHWRRRLAALAADCGDEGGGDVQIDDPELREILRHTCDAVLLGGEVLQPLRDRMFGAPCSVDAPGCCDVDGAAEEDEEPTEEEPNMPEQRMPEKNDKRENGEENAPAIVVDLSEDDDAEIARDAELERSLQRALSSSAAGLDRFGLPLELPASRLRMLVHHAIVENSLSGLEWLHRNVRLRRSKEEAQLQQQQQQQQEGQEEEGQEEEEALFAWDAHAPNLAAELGRTPILEYLLDNGCPADPAAVCASAARGGHLPVLELLLDAYDAEMGADCIEAALDDDAAGGGGGDRTKIVDWLLARGAPLRPHALWLAVKRGSVHWCRQLFAHMQQRDALLLLLAPSTMTPEWTALAASGRRDPNVLMWLRDVAGCPWDETCTAAAAARETPYLLQRARTGGCPWNESAVLAAITHLRPDSLAFCMENGCPFLPSAMHHRLCDAVAAASTPASRADGEACRALLKPRLPLHPFFFPSLSTRKRRRAAMKKSGGGGDASTHTESSVSEEEQDRSADVMREWLGGK